MNRSDKAFPLPAQPPAGGPPWHILGAGALGGLWASYLAETRPVILLSRPETENPAHVGKSDPTPILDQVLTCETPAGQRNATLPVIPANRWQGPIHRLLVATKSQDTLPSISTVRDSLTRDSLVLLMQNGIGSQLEVRQRFPQLKLFAATTTEGANRAGPLHVRHAGQGKTVIGPWSSLACQPDCRQVATELAASGLSVETSDAIASALWHKLAINAAINPFTLILDCPNGALPGKALFQDSIHPLCAEISAVLATAGHPLSTGTLYRQVIEVARATYANISSMLQDYRQGKPSEIHYINGVISRQGKAAGLATPVNDGLVAQVRQLEKTHLSMNAGDTDG